jgi:hypothetical protein
VCVIAGYFNAHFAGFPVCAYDQDVTPITGWMQPKSAVQSNHCSRAAQERSLEKDKERDQGPAHHESQRKGEKPEEQAEKKSRRNNDTDLLPPGPLEREPVETKRSCDDHPPEDPDEDHGEEDDPVAPA